LPDEIASSIGIEAYIYDSVKVDELIPEARISGMPALPRTRHKPRIKFEGYGY